MERSSTLGHPNKRRELLQSTAAGLGIAGLGALTGSSLQAGTRASDSAGSALKPLYVRTSSQSANAVDQPLSLSEVPDPAIRALRRLGFGYLPEDLGAFNALGADFDERLENYVDAQLDGYQPGYPPTNDASLTDILNEAGTNFETLDDSLATLWTERFVADLDWPYYVYPLIETQYLALLRAVYSEWQLAEVLADFWHTHFSVDGGKFEVSPVFVHYDRDVIRPNMLGNFRQMIEAVTTSTAMMYYLDNVWNSVYGPNENYAREIQELHTLGAVHSFGFTPENEIPAATPMAGSSTVLPSGLKAGYSEADVRQVTLCLTGWTISNAYTDGLNTGEFLYWSNWHDLSPKRVMGIDLAATGQGETSEVLDLLAMHPGTARYVCTKLCGRLIGDNPPNSIIETAATVFNDQWQAADQLKQVVRTILLSDEFKDAGFWGEKTRKPFELLAGTLRSCGGPALKLVRPDPFGNYIANLQKGENYQFSQQIYWRLGEAGNLPYSWVTPDGFPDKKEAWLGSTPLIMGWKTINSAFLDWFPDDPTNTSGSWHPIFPVDAVATTKSVLSVSDRTPSKIVDYWVRQFLGYDAAIPGSPQFDSSLRDMLVAFMQQDAPGPDSALDLDLDGWSNQTHLAYVSQRVQTLVASIAMLPDNLLR